VCEREKEIYLFVKKTFDLSREENQFFVTMKRRIGERVKE
jgi:hypothetical protein